MSLSKTLTEYLDHDTSSRGSPNQLANILIKEPPINAQDLSLEKLTKLVEGLDRVCLSLLLLHSALNGF